MTENFVKVKVSNISDIVKLSLLLKDFDFRGQKRRDWEISSSYERELQDFKDFKPIEQAVITDFKVKSCCYLSKRPEDDDYFNWLAYNIMAVLQD